MTRVIVVVMLSGCGRLADDASKDAGAHDADCAVVCEAGQVCIHSYYTHDPPPPLPEGGACPPGTPQRYDRCWGVTDRCDSVPRECVATPSCSCPPVAPLWAQGCECGGGGTFNCYAIGK